MIENQSVPAQSQGTITDPEPASAAATPAPVVTPEPTPVAPVVTPDPVAEPQSGDLSPAEPSPDPGTEPAPERIVPIPGDYKLPEGVPKEIAEFANKTDMTQEQLDATLTQFGGLINRNRQQEQLTLKQAGEEFVKSWGDNSKHNLSLAKRALKQNDPSGTLSKALKISGFGNHPAVIDFLYTIGKSMQEGGFLTSAVNRPTGEKTAAQSMYPDNPTENT